MRWVEVQLRRFGAALYVTPGFSNWVRQRARELARDGQTFEVVLVWGRRKFRVGNVPHGNAYFAIQRDDGTIERSPWASD